MESFKLNTIEEAVADFAEGKFVIVVDDEDRENEGDLVIAAEKITAEQVNFMLKNARGVLCAPITIERCKELDLPHQVQDNTSVLGTPFTVTVDKLEGCTTGVSAHDRAETIKALADPASRPETFGRPGHVNPLYAQENGVLRRSGHTEATIDLCRMAGLYPAGALMEIMNEDGTMARLPQLMKFAKEWDMKIISIKDMIAYRLKKESLIEVGEEVDMPTDYGHFRLIPFRQKSTGLEHLALIKGEWKDDEPILVRVHSSCMTGDILGSKRCDCGEQLHKAMQAIEKEGKGVVIYMQQEGRGIGLMNKIAAYKLQEEGYDTVDANVHLGFKPDERDYGCGAQMLRHLGVHKMRLLTNNPVKRVGLEAYGLEIIENVPIEVTPNPYNLHYLETKKNRMGATLAMSQKSSEMKAQGIDVINMSVGEPDFNTPDHIKQAAKLAIDENYSRYSPVPGYPDLRQAIARKLERENHLHYAPSEILVSNGAKQSVCNTIMALVNDGEEVIIPAPYWVSYPQMVKLAGGEPVIVEAGFDQNFKMTAEQLEAAITPKTRMIILCSPSNPTGSVYNKEELKALADVILKHDDLFVLADEIYEHINYIGKHESIAQFPGMKERAIIVNGVSKAYAMTGWRIGYIAAPEWIVKGCNKLQGQYTSGPCSVSQKAAEFAYISSQECVEEMRQAFERRRNLIVKLAKEIPGLEVNVPEGAFYLFPKCSSFYGKSDGETTINNSTDFAMYLLEKGHVATVGGDAFGDPECFRMSYATSDENIIEAMTRIRNTVAKLK